MAVDWAPLVDFLRRHERVLLMTHVRPDADGLGSQLALAEALETLGKKPRVVIASKLAPRYHFLDPGRTRVEQFHPPGERFADVDAVLVMDTGTWNQLGEFGPYLRTLTVPKAVVDHHRTQDDLGGERYVDVSAEATGRLAREIISALGVPLTPSMARNLFMAVALDTGWFRHPNTTPETFALAEELVRAGAEPTPLYEQLFECAPLGRLKLVGLALQRMQLRAGGQIAFTEVFLPDYAACDAVPGDTEDLINYARSIDGSEVALIFIEQADGSTKVSFRARSKVDVSRLAEQFGGGGHRLASGAKTHGALADVREAVLAATEAALRDADSQASEGS